MFPKETRPIFPSPKQIVSGLTRSKSGPLDPEGLSTEIIVAIAVGAAVLPLLLLMIPLCMYLIAARGRRSRTDYLYREDYERKPHYAKRQRNGSGYDVQFETNGVRQIFPNHNQREWFKLFRAEGYHCMGENFSITTERLSFFLLK